MPPGGRPMSQESVFGVWFGAAFPAGFLGIVVGMSVALRADDPAWGVWAGRAVLFGVCWVMAFFPAALSFRELGRRGEWLPPGAARRPWLSGAAYAAGALSLSAAVIAGLAACLELLGGRVQG